MLWFLIFDIKPEVEQFMKRFDIGLTKTDGASILSLLHSSSHVKKLYFEINTASQTAYQSTNIKTG